MLFSNSRLIDNIMGERGYSVWWQLSDVNHKFIRCCEVMIKIIYQCSRLKSDDYTLEGTPFSERACSRCDNFAHEDVKHIVLQCESNFALRDTMFKENMNGGVGKTILDNPADILLDLLGKFCPLIEEREMFEFLKITCVYISQIYWNVINDRLGIG